MPWGHLGGGNLPEESVIRWLRTNLRDRTVHCTNAKAEAHMLYQLGLDPEQLGVKFTDIAFNAALLNENRYAGFSLEALCEEYLPPGERKVHPGLDPEMFWSGHSSEVAERCISDARQAYLVHEVTWPRLQAEQLERVFELENCCILPTVEMERNGAILDRPKLERWVVECDRKIEELFLATHAQTGLRVNPDKPSELQRLFDHLRLAKPSAYDDDTRSYQPSFSEEALATVKHPVIERIRQLRKLRSLRSKYLLKYLNAIDGNNVLRYQLHQLRTDNDDQSGHRGTVTGRYSCGGGEFAVNIQQVYKAEKQVEKMGPDFLIRELFVPELGRQIGASDAAGIEFRLFGHYSRSRFIAETYRQDPHTDFHLMVTKMMKPKVTDPAELKGWRKHIKNQNFAKVYGVGRPKLARKLGLACTCLVDIPPWEFALNSNHDPHCPARQANDIIDEYEEKFSEAGDLLKQASKVAEHRGYVKSMLGGRRRYPDGKRLHSALNAVIQRTAAEYFKLKLRELYDARHALGITLRAPVHDEFMYDADPDPAAHARVRELLDAQSWPQLRVPLLWDSGFGRNWREANEGGV